MVVTGILRATALITANWGGVFLRTCLETRIRVLTEARSFGVILVIEYSTM